MRSFPYSAIRPAFVGLLMVTGAVRAAQTGPTQYRTSNLAGWTVRVNERLLDREHQRDTLKALALLRLQLKEIVRVVPKAAVNDLVQVTLWFSPRYEGFPPRAEYHPSAEWLRQNGRSPSMEKGIEFTNIEIFEKETKRMPNFALHELAHAFHDRVLGAELPAIKVAYEKAKAGGKYDDVEQRHGDGRSSKGKAYAMSNHQEYFAECTEAFFGQNDFFPFSQAELLKHDPEIYQLLRQLWGGLGSPKSP